MLNSITIEGNVAVVFEDGFFLETTRVISEKEVRTFRFKIEDKRNKVKKGQFVRVVGYLTNNKGETIIVAEYAEQIRREAA